jgi:uncharacterized protein YbbC (DUF1343 family)
MASKTVPGIDTFVKTDRFRGSRIGLITNPSGVTSAGVPTWKALMNAGFRLEAIFGPEHGFRGEAQDGVQVTDDTFHGVRVHSLFGDRERPTDEMIRDLDLMVFDIQDVGCRYYTYLYTLAYALEACEAAGKSFCVLDRPNPIGAVLVEGGPIAQDAVSFVGGYGLPPQYGMTIGEYARYLKGEYVPKADLEVITLKRYRRDQLFGATGLPWIAASPNLPTVDTAIVYPGTCLFEGTNVSEGRGTTRPFETIGAPWLDSEQLREALMELELPGAAFSSTYFAPTFSKYKGELCQGVVLHVTDRALFRPLRTALAMLWVLKRDWADRFQWKPNWEGDFSYVDRLAGGPYLRDMFDAGKGLDEVYARACLDQGRFESTRAHYLIYRD